jgi:hypothetical protein
MHADILKLCLIIKMFHLNVEWLESTNGFDILYMGLDKLYLMNHIKSIILSQS